MKYFTTIMVSFFVVGLIRTEINQSLIDKLKQAYAQSMNDVISDLITKKSANQQVADNNSAPISRVTKVIANTAPMHKRVFKSANLSDNEASNPLIANLERLLPVNFENGTETPNVKISSFVEKTNLFRGADGKMHMSKEIHNIQPANINMAEQNDRVPRNAEVLHGSNDAENPMGFLSGLLNLPFEKDIDEEGPSSVLSNAGPQNSNFVNELFGKLGGQPDNKVVSHHRRIRTHRTKRVTKRRIVRRRVVPVNNINNEEPLHPKIAHVANLYGNFLDGEIEKHQNNLPNDDESAYHHKVLTPKLITVREIGAPQDNEDSSDTSPLAELINNQQGGANPLNLIENILSGLGGDQNKPQNIDESPIMNLSPSSEDAVPIHIRIIGSPASDEESPIGSIFGNLLSHLQGNDISEESTPVVQHRTSVTRTHHAVHHVQKIHKIQHANSLNLPVSNVPLQNLLETLEDNLSPSQPQVSDQKPVVIVRRISTPLLNDNYGKPLFYGASTFPSLGHSSKRKVFSPFDFLHLMQNDNDLPDPRNRNREPGTITHKKRNNRRRVDNNIRAALTKEDLDQLIGGLLPNMVRRKRNLSKFRAV